MLGPASYKLAAFILAWLFCFFFLSFFFFFFFWWVGGGKGEERGGGVGGGGGRLPCWLSVVCVNSRSLSSKTESFLCLQFPTTRKYFGTVISVQH